MPTFSPLCRAVKLVQPKRRSPAAPADSPPRCLSERRPAAPDLALQARPEGSRSHQSHVAITVPVRRRTGRARQHSLCGSPGTRR